MIQIILWDNSNLNYIPKDFNLHSLWDCMSVWMNVNVKNYELQIKKFLLRHNLDELGRFDPSTVDQSEILDVWGGQTC